MKKDKDRKHRREQTHRIRKGRCEKKAKGQERESEATDLRVWKKEIDEMTGEDRGKETREHGKGSRQRKFKRGRKDTLNFHCISTDNVNKW